MVARTQLRTQLWAPATLVVVAVVLHAYRRRRKSLSPPRSDSSPARRPVFDGNINLLRKVLDIAHGKGTEESQALLRAWRTLSRAERQFADMFFLAPS